MSGSLSGVPLPELTLEERAQRRKKLIHALLLIAAEKLDEVGKVFRGLIRARSLIDRLDLFKDRAEFRNFHWRALMVAGVLQTFPISPIRALFASSLCRFS